MAFRHHPQTNRRELKYIVSEPAASAVSRFIRSYLEPDEHTRPGQEQGYPVWSLYLDTPSLALYRQTIDGLKNRFKLRLRFYDRDPAAPVFLEIKRRVAGVVCKERAGITRRAAWEMLSRGARPSPGDLVESDEDEHPDQTLETFCRLRESIAGEGALYVSYLREAYTSPDSDEVRVTFDREIQGSCFAVADGIAPPPPGARPRIDGVVLELKFTDRFPRWMSELVQTYSLQPLSVPKYVHCIDAVGLQPPHDPTGLFHERLGAHIAQQRLRLLA